jgi:hypothetical protein
MHTASPPPAGAIARQVLALHQSHFHTLAHDLFKQLLEQLRLLKTLFARDAALLTSIGFHETQLSEAAQVNHTVRQYRVELEQQNPSEEPVHEQKLVSSSDPDATYATKGGTPARLGYYNNYLVDNHSCVIVGVPATAARMSQETVAAQDMLARFARWQGRDPESVAADATYGNGEFLQG